MHTEVGTTAT